MLDGAGAGGRESSYARLGPGMLDEFLDRLRGRGIRHDHHVREGGKARDGGQIGDRVIAEGWKDEGICCEEARRDEEGVTVGSRLHGCLRSDIAAGAAFVLDHHLLAPELGQPVGKHAGDRIGRSARGKRHHEAHVAARIGLCPGSKRYGRERGSARGQMQKLTPRKLHDVFTPWP